MNSIPLGKESNLGVLAPKLATDSGPAPGLLYQSFPPSAPLWKRLGKCRAGILGGGSQPADWLEKHRFFALKLTL